MIGGAPAVDWRARIDALRPHSHELWRRFSEVDQREAFARWATVWSVHRARMAPEIASQIGPELQSGALRVVAMRSVDPVAAGERLDSMSCGRTGRASGCGRRRSSTARGRSSTGRAPASRCCAGCSSWGSAPATTRASGSRATRSTASPRASSPSATRSSGSYGSLSPYPRSRSGRRHRGAHRLARARQKSRGASSPPTSVDAASRARFWFCGSASSPKRSNSRAGAP